MSSHVSTWECVLTPLHLEGVIFNCISSESAEKTFSAYLLQNTSEEIKPIFSLRFAGASFCTGVRYGLTVFDFYFIKRMTSRRVFLRNVSLNSVRHHLLCFILLLKMQHLHPIKEFLDLPFFKVSSSLYLYHCHCKRQLLSHNWICQ